MDQVHETGHKQTEGERRQDAQSYSRPADREIHSAQARGAGMGIAIGLVAGAVIGYLIGWLVFDGMSGRVVAAIVGAVALSTAGGVSGGFARFGKDL